MTLTNNVVAKNNDNGSGPDIRKFSGIITDGGHNLIGDGTGQTTIVNGTNGNQVGTTAMPIDPLFVTDVDMMSLPNSTGDLRLRICSPVIDAGKDTMGLNLGLIDLAGEQRVFGTAVDIGAYETQQSSTEPLIVMNTDDDGPMSLRYLVDIACAGDTITFDSGIDGDTIKLITEISLDTKLVILGNNTTNTIIDGMNTSRIFYIPAGDTVSISGIKMQGGNGSGAIVSGTGGAIRNRGSLTLTNTTVNGNSASNSGGGIFNSTGTLTMTNTTVNGNSASNSGGGIYNRGTLTLTNSTVSGNTTTNFGGGSSTQVQQP